MLLLAICAPVQQFQRPRCAENRFAVRTCQCKNTTGAIICQSRLARTARSIRSGEPLAAESAFDGDGNTRSSGGMLKQIFLPCLRSSLATAFEDATFSRSIASRSSLDVPAATLSRRGCLHRRNRHLWSNTEASTHSYKQAKESSSAL